MEVISLIGQNDHVPKLSSLKPQLWVVMHLFQCYDNTCFQVTENLAWTNLVKKKKKEEEGYGEERMATASHKHNKI